MRIEIAPRAKRDLKKLSASTLRRIEGALSDLAAGVSNLDIKPLRGREPWRRLRVGGYRLIYRPLTAAEARKLPGAGGKGFLLARVVDRKEQDRAIKRLR